ncbi:MAG TPA: fibronectin type III domain-containing protein, partial [Candidatus Sulfotelmatobacter sp.]|nr:fibronectin type III domain-containing protein [Candidatus Sulfotelmatobacter sp.]
RPVTPSGPDFTVVILPDIQNYTAETNGGSTAILQTQTEWIRTNREALNIVYVAQEGDLSQNGDNDPDQSEWLNASSALYSLETPLAPFAEGIPYGVAVGNHDQIVPAGDTQPTTSFNQYFGLPHFTGKSYYGGFYSTANNNNYYQLFSASGLDFLVVYFEFDSTPDQAVLDWANALLQANADRRAIVVTHYLLETTAAWGTQGLAIYNALKANPNLFLMLCGHNHGEAQRTDVYAGNTVYTLLADYQSYAYGGSGYLRLLEFSPANNQIRVKTYSPWLKQFETDADSQFTLNYSLSAGPPFALVQQHSGVASGTITTAAWTGLQPGTQYEWYVSATDGVETRTSELRRFTTLLEGNPPAAPSNLVATPESETEMLLTWTDGSDNESGFEVYQSMDAGPFALVGATPPNTTRVTITGLQPSTAYAFRVRAVSVFGPSADSNEATATTLAPPPAPEAPTGLTATPLSPTGNQLAWTDNSTAETGFQLERSLDNVAWTALPMLAADLTNAVDAGLTAGTVYYYRVRAWRGSSASAPSQVAAAAPFIDAYPSGETLLAGTVTGSSANTLANDSSYEQI